MHEGLTQELLTIAGVTWLISVLIVSRPLRLNWAVAVATLKIGILVVYFGWFYDGSWTIKDDKEYHKQATILLESELNSLDMLFTSAGFESLKDSTERSRHVLYTWWVYTTQYIFGPVYYAPVFFNAVLTFVVGAILYRLCNSEGFTEWYSRGLLVVFLLHWDVLVWSSFISIKDSLVMTLTIGAFALGWPLIKHPAINVRTLLAILGLGVIVYVLTFTRFYIPVLLLAATLWYLFLRIEGIQKYYFLTSGVVVVLAIILFTPLIQFHIEKDIDFDWASVAFGVFRFPLTPKPWSLEPAYTFLFVPSILHWLSFVPAIIGGYSLWKRSDLARLLILFLLTAIVFYAIVDLLQNTRQRYQFSYIVVWMQYHSVLLIINRYRPKKGIPVAV